MPPRSSEIEEAIRQAMLDIIQEETEKLLAWHVTFPWKEEAEAEAA